MNRSSGWKDKEWEVRDGKRGNEGDRM